MSATLQMWTIYWNPKDHPGKFVVRRWDVTAGSMKPSHSYALAPTLDLARAHLPDGLYCLGRQPEDEEQIVETWI
jgi:hypothetical protein